MHYQSQALANRIPLAPMSETDLWLIGIVAAFFVVVLLLRAALFLRDFSMELRYLNMEIARSEGAEREYYKHRRRRLWLSLIPFVRY